MSYIGFFHGTFLSLGCIKNLKTFSRKDKKSKEINIIFKRKLCLNLFNYACFCEIFFLLKEQTASFSYPNVGFQRSDVVHFWELKAFIVIAMIKILQY